MIAALLVAVAGQEPFVSRVAEGQAVTKHRLVELRCELRSASTETLLGRIPEERLRDEFTLRAREEVTDRTTDVRWDEPYTFERTFHRLELTGELGAIGRGDLRRTSPLEGRTLEFDWDGEHHRWERRLVGEPYLTIDLWNGARVDRDALWLLPRGEREEWTLDPEELLVFLLPDQDLLGREQRAADEQDQGLLELGVDLWEHALATGSAQGRARARRDGTRRAPDGRELPAIALEFRLEGGVGGEERGPYRFFAVLLDGWTLEGGGSLLWDPAAGRLHSLTVEAEVEVESTVELAFEREAGQRGLEVVWWGHREEHWHGTLRVEVGIGPLDDGGGPSSPWTGPRD